MSKKVLIVGAGITGLGLAALLKKSGVVVKIVDKAPSLNQPGYGITLMPDGLAVMSKLGLRESVDALGTSSRNIQVITPQKGVLKTFDLADSGVDSVTVNRADLHKLLGKTVGVKNITFNTSVSSIEETHNGAYVTFTDGASDRFDLVVGADGINSVVRSLIFPGNIPEYTGAAIWSFNVPKRFWSDNPRTVKSYWGEERFMGIFPIKGGAAVAFSMPLSPDIRPSTVDIAKAFSGMSPDVARLIAAAKDNDVYSSHLRNIKLKHWYKGTVVLAGDAAHAMMPSTGMGASIGLQDADVLARLILETSEGELTTVPKAYEKKRKHQAESTQRQAFSVGKLMLARGLKVVVRDTLIPLVPKDAFSRSIAK
jgi:2-polyprenyl-6-methoxyphenol hydroxylase-like FAD-dependent oxidoreductase